MLPPKIRGKHTEKLKSRNNFDGGKNRYICETQYSEECLTIPIHESINNCAICAPFLGSALTPLIMKSSSRDRQQQETEAEELFTFFTYNLWKAFVAYLASAFCNRQHDTIFNVTPGARILVTWALSSLSPSVRNTNEKFITRIMGMISFCKLVHQWLI